MTEEEIIDNIEFKIKSDLGVYTNNLSLDYSEQQYNNGRIDECKSILKIIKNLRKDKFPCDELIKKLE